MVISFKNRALALLLSFVLLLSLIPITTLHVHAAGNLTASDPNIGLSWSDASNSKGTANWTASGTTVTGTSKGYKGGFMNLASYSVTTTLTITNNHSDARTLSFDWSLSNGGSVSGIISGNSGTYYETLEAGSSVIITLTSPSGNSTNTLTISGLALLSANNLTSTFFAPQNGSYTVDGTPVNADTQFTKVSTEAYSLEATPAANYIFFGWWSEYSQSYVSYDSAVSLKFSSDPQLKPVFLHNTTALFGVGDNVFENLTKACDFAASSAATTKTVILLNNGTVSGNHTIPKGVTLLVPHDSSNTMYGSKAKCTTQTIFGFADAATDWVQPTAYRTLTMAADAKIIVDGSIELAGQHAASNGARVYCGAPSGPLGWMKMASGSNITLNSGSNLYCWGYIQGAGTITAKSGSKVYENFQFTDFRGGSNITAMMGDEGKSLVFPINQYYVQNIETLVSYEAGAKEYVATSAFSSRQVVGGTFEFLGAGGMFTPSEGAVISKDYIESRDRLHIEVDGDAGLNSLQVDVGIEPIDSSDFVLPITNNVTIVIKSGTTTINQSVSILPGAEITIDKAATLVISKGTAPINSFTTESFGLIIYDYDEWTYGISMEDGSKVAGKYAFGNGSTSYNGQMSPLKYAPGRTYNRTVANDLKDAKLDVNGKIICNGYLYTTVGGGNIISSEKTGSIQLVSGAGNDMKDFQSNAAASLIIPMQSAQLKNGDGSYTNTYTYHYDDEGALVVDYQAPANTTFEYCAIHDCWYAGECHECNAVYTITWIVDGVEIKTDIPNGEIPVYPNGTPIKTADAQYTYTFTGWDVTPVAATQNATYTAQFSNTLRKYEITWIVDGNATTVEIDYGTLPTFSGDIVKAPDSSYHYTFSGWDVTPTAVTGNATYTAKFDVAAHDKAMIEGGKHYCSVCNYLMGSCIDTGNDHKCDIGGEQMTCGNAYLTLTEGQAADCTTDGWKGYYSCSCGKLYSDPEATKQIIDLADWKASEGNIAALGHAGSIVYKDNGDGTHSASYTECGHIHIANEAHSHINGVCICENILKGDADFNGVVNEDDNVILTMILLKSGEYSEILDMNDDGKIDVIDGVLLRRKIGK